MKAPRLLTALVMVFMLHALAATRSSGIQFGVARQTVQYSEETFDKTNFNQLTVTAARKKCEDSMNATVALVEKAFLLTSDQKTKLELAGEIDIHRFFFDYAIAKQGLKFGTIPRDQWQTQFAAAQKKILPLKTRYSDGLHGESSLFDKTMTTVLDKKQNESVQALFRERERLRYANYIQATLKFVDRKIPLTASQRSTISELLLTHTKPPESFGTSSTPLYLVLSRMGQIEDELGEVFSDEEMVVIRQLILSGRAGLKQARLR